MSEWIDVNDRLPDGWNNVLAYTENNGCIVAHHDDTWRSRNDRPLKCTVTHWMPLPSRPSERKPNESERVRTCGQCKNWEHGSCNLPRSPRFTDTTSATDGCTPNKRARGNWI